MTKRERDRKNLLTKKERVKTYRQREEKTKERKKTH